MDQPDRPQRNIYLDVGRYAWATVGLALALVIAGFVVQRLSIVVIPLGLALFPAALLYPVARQLKKWKVPPSLASLITLLAFAGVIAGIITLIIPAVRDQAPVLIEQATDGLFQLEETLEDLPFGIEPGTTAELIEDVQTFIMESDVIREGLVSVAGAVGEIITMTVLMIVILFFFLKDGPAIARFLRRLFPRRVQADVAEIGKLSWTTIGAYFRGQLFVALVDAIGIGVGLALLGVPLALPLAVIVFFGGLFPIVGAFISGALAVFVALADGGLGIGLAVLAIVIGVQQLESNVLAPVVLGKATEINPLAVLLSLTAGAVLLNLLGAFIAVPIAASITRAVRYVRARVDGELGPPPETIAEVDADMAGRVTKNRAGEEAADATEAAEARHPKDVDDDSEDSTDTPRRASKRLRPKHRRDSS